MRRAQLQKLLEDEYKIYEMELNKLGKAFYIKRTWYPDCDTKSVIFQYRLILSFSKYFYTISQKYNFTVQVFCYRLKFILKQVTTGLGSKIVVLPLLANQYSDVVSLKDCPVLQHTLNVINAGS